MDIYCWVQLKQSFAVDGAFHLLANIFSKVSGKYWNGSHGISPPGLGKGIHGKTGSEKSRDTVPLTVVWTTSDSLASTAATSSTKYFLMIHEWVGQFEQCSFESTKQCFATFWEKSKKQSWKRVRGIVIKVNNKSLLLISYQVLPHDLFNDEESFIHPFDF